MWLELAAITYLGGRYAWHKIFKEDPPPRPKTEVTVPRTEEGEVIPLIYGRARVRSPVLAWVGTPHMIPAADYYSPYDPAIEGTADKWFCSMFFVAGVPFLDGTNHIHNMWAGESKLFPRLVGLPDLATGGTFVNFEDLTGDGGFEDQARSVLAFTAEWGTQVGGYIEFLNGKSTQVLFDPITTSPTTVAGRYMTVYEGSGPTELQGTTSKLVVPAYRGYMSMMLYHASVSPAKHWSIATTQVPAHSFEVSSYMAIPIYSDNQGAGAPRPGVEENPVTVIFDILTRWLGIPRDDIDGANFYAASIVLYQEGNGYSRVIEKDTKADELLGDILMQMDAVMYLDTSNSKIKIKLLRNDYDPTKIPVISRTNGCLFEPTGVGWADTPNKVRIVFSNRAKAYQDDSVEAQNLANVIANGMKVNEVVMHMPAVCTAAQAADIAARELAHLSQPLITGTAYVDRTQYRLNPGDPVKVNWTDPDIGGIVFRVVNIDKGRREDGKIKVDLIQDSYFVWRSRIPISQWLDHIDVSDLNGLT
jgi:hypothetical protein